ncbi:MAG: hypothetical protein J5563_01580 [Clostridia bacterium]|nr:hypothetical protein [Clostridia bacterium]
MKKTAAFILALVFVICAVACSKNNEPGDASGTASGDNSDVFATLSDFDGYADGFDGETFRIINSKIPVIEDGLCLDFESDPEADSVISNAIYRRNGMVEERFNVKIENYATETLRDDIFEMTSTGDTDYCAIYGVYNTMAGLAAEGMLGNLRELPCIDFGSSHWNQSAEENLTIGEVQYFAINDIAYTTLMSTHCMFFNKKLAEDFSLKTGNPYDYVFDGNWTIDKLLETSRGVAKDLNGDGRYNEEDQYGFALSIGSSTMFGVSLGESVYPVKIRNGEIIETDEEKWAGIIDKIYNLCYNNDGSTFVGEHLSSTATSMFLNGKALYYVGALCEVPNYFRGMEDDFGILPMPKYEEKQDYRTPLSGGSAIFGTPMLHIKYKNHFIGFISEALAIASTEKIRSAVYDTVFENQLTRDEESKKTLNIIEDSMYVDFVFLHAGGIEGYYGEIHMLMDQKSNNYSSARRRNKTRVENYSREVLDMYNGINR